jgi:hypothetical protein
MPSQRSLQQARTIVKPINISQEDIPKAVELIASALDSAFEEGMEAQRTNQFLRDVLNR